MFTFCGPVRIEVGVDSLNGVGSLAKLLGGTKVLIVMDSFLASGSIRLDERVVSILAEAGITAAVYKDITGEPTSDNVAEGLAAIADNVVDCIVALGGGSAIDTAKAVAVMAVNSHLAFKDIPQQVVLRRLPLIAIPTTSGTGSEASKVSVITNAKTGVKENPGHPALIPDVAVLDPQLTMTLPPDLTAFTGMDALTHAIEAYVSNRASNMSDLHAYQAIKLAGQWLDIAVAEGSNTQARLEMALASCLAGIAFSNASTNLAHAAGRAMGAHFHVPHGLSVALYLPFVMEFGIEYALDKYACCAVALGANPHLGKRELAQKAIEIINNFNTKFHVWEEAKNKYIPNVATYRQAIPLMVKNALSGNGILTNPRVPDEKDVTLVFEKLALRLESLANPELK